MNDEIKEILEDVKRHLDYVETTKQASIRDNEMKAMYDYITNLQEELEEEKRIEQADFKTIQNLEEENEKLKYNARGQVNDYFKDKYADEVLKNAELQEENQKLKEEILNLQQKLMYLR